MGNLVTFNNLIGKKILITGHSGFKGRWLCQMLLNLSCDVYGISRTDKHKEIFEDLGLDVTSQWFDIKSFSQTQRTILDIKPDYIFHFAAQSLVGESYTDPLETVATNVMGSVNIMEVLRSSNLHTHLMYITTDKVYHNNEWLWGYREIDPLGGKDLYSSSKAAADLIAQSFINSFSKNETNYSVSICRAGNVIGGGDYADKRIVPDIFKSIDNMEVLKVRQPNSTRPWQHVIDCLGGYLTLANQLPSNERLVNQSWNFGPDQDSNKAVIKLVEKFSEHVPQLNYVVVENKSFEEAKYLYLDCSKAKRLLGWKPVFSFDETVRLTSAWSGQKLISSTLALMKKQINDYYTKVDQSLPA